MRTKEEKREYDRQWVVANREKTREYTRKSYAKHLEKNRASRRQKYAIDPEKPRARRRALYATNPERFAEEARKRRAADPELVRTIERKSRAANPEKRRESSHRASKKRRENPLNVFKAHISIRLWGALLRIGGQKAGRRTEELLGFTKQALHDHLISFLDKPCGWCTIPLMSLTETSIDHIIPICTAKTEAEVISLNQLPNLRLVHKVCNSMKGSKLPILKEQP